MAKKFGSELALAPVMYPADRVDVEAAAKHNILVLHDFKHKTGFVAANQPVLCASCHQSNALAEVGGPGGIDTVDNMSSVMHGLSRGQQLPGWNPRWATRYAPG